MAVKIMKKEEEMKKEIKNKMEWKAEWGKNDRTIKSAELMVIRERDGKLLLGDVKLI